MKFLLGGGWVYWGWGGGRVSKFSAGGGDSSPPPSRENPDKSNIKLYSENRQGIIQEKQVFHFLTEYHHGTHNDIKVLIIVYCNANCQEQLKDFQIFHLRASEHSWWRVPNTLIFEDPLILPTTSFSNSDHPLPPSLSPPPSTLTALFVAMFHWLNG